MAERRVDERSESTDEASGARSEESEDRGPRDRRPEQAVSRVAESGAVPTPASRRTPTDRYDYWRE